jgi:protein-S-isoprenylcysteine O-methyltransferase Ste14
MLDEKPLSDSFEKSYLLQCAISSMKSKIYNYIPLSTLAASIVLAVTLNFLLPVRQVLPFPYNLSGLPIVILGLYLAYQSVHQLIAHKTTFEPSENPSSLVVECPYRYSRNPIYLGLLLVIAGIAVTLSSLTALLAPLIFYLVVNSVVIPFEEKNLLKNLGPSYENYQKSVRRWI